MFKVFGIAGNKCDKFEEEKVDKNEVEIFAKEIGALFQLTSAESNIGIKKLFTDLGKQFLDSNLGNKNRKSVKLDEDSEKSDSLKKGCC